MKTPPLVLFHANCFDGFTAAWVFKKFKGEADFVPVLYGDETIPSVKGRDVWLLDFSYPRETMKNLIVASNKTTVVDHHKTAEQDLAGILQEIRTERNVQREYDNIIFDMTRSGAGMIFDILETELAQRRGLRQPRLNGQRPVWLVDYVEDRDLWKNKLFRSKEVNAWISCVPMTFDAWDALSAMSIADVASRGDYILTYQRIYGERAIANARPASISGHDVLVVNLPYMNCSEYLGWLADRNPDVPFVVGYFMRGDGKWQMSLRSRGEFDVSEIAKQFGGGGHKNAAGFQSDDLPWNTCECGAPLTPGKCSKNCERDE